MSGAGTLGIGSIDPPRERCLSPEGLGHDVRELLAGADYVVVRPGPGSVRTVLMRLHSLDPAVQVILAPAEERRAEVERTLLFTPGVGEVWIASAEELGAELFHKAAEVTRNRRSYPATRARLERGLERVKAASTERRRISDAFLAALLDVVPDPVLSLDEHGLVISANPAAGALLDGSATGLEGRRLADVLHPEDAVAFAALLEHGRRQQCSAEITFSKPDGTRGAVDISIAPVQAGVHRVRCVVLHDVTEERRVRRELEEQASVLEEEAAAHEKVNRELGRRTEELERVMAMRSRFYAGMSHELRTPLNAIIGYNSLLLDGVLGELPENLETPLRRAQRAAEHLLDLVSDVLDLAKIEVGRIDLALDTVRFPDELQELADTVRPLGEDHGVELRVVGPEERHSVVTDPRRLRQILLNLLSNAVRHGGGEPVQAEWAPDPQGGVVVSVIDRGPGIPAARLDEIFEEFVKFESPGDQSGTGLGLTISRRLAQAIGARLEVESEVGRGSAFHLVLPSRIEATPPPHEF